MAHFMYNWSFLGCQWVQFLYLILFTLGDKIQKLKLRYELQAWALRRESVGYKKSFDSHSKCKTRTHGLISCSELFKRLDTCAADKISVFH